MDVSDPLVGIYVHLRKVLVAGLDGRHILSLPDVIPEYPVPNSELRTFHG